MTPTLPSCKEKRMTEAGLEVKGPSSRKIYSRKPVFTAKTAKPFWPSLSVLVEGIIRVVALEECPPAKVCETYRN